MNKAGTMCFPFRENDENTSDQFYVTTIIRYKPIVPFLLTSRVIKQVKCSAVMSHLILTGPPSTVIMPSSSTKLEKVDLIMIK